MVLYQRRSDGEILTAAQLNSYLQGIEDNAARIVELENNIAQVHVGTGPPASPQTGELWFDTDEMSAEFDALTQVEGDALYAPIGSVPTAVGTDGEALVYNGGIPRTYPLNHWDVQWSGATAGADLPRTATDADFTTLYNSLTDSTVAIQAAHDKAKSLGVKLVGRGVYRVDGTLEFSTDFDFSGAMFLCNSTTVNPVLRIGKTNDITYRLTAVAPYVRNQASGATVWTTATSCGIETVNLESSDIRYLGAWNFGVGLRFTAASGFGHVYNEYHLGYLINNKITVQLTTVDEPSWTNENKFYGGKFAHTSDKANETVGARHIQLWATEGAAQASGPVASATSTTITSGTLDGGVSLTADQIDDRIITIVSGTGAGQMRTVTANTAGTTTTITVSTAWDTIPDATSTFRVARFSILNQNYFYSPSLEGDGPEYTIDIFGMTNGVFDARYETHETATVFPKVRWYGPHTKDNRVEYGYDLDKVVETFAQDASASNRVIHMNRRDYTGVTNEMGVTSSSNYVRRIFPTATKNHVDTAATFLQSAIETVWKSGSGTTPFFRVHYQGEISWRNDVTMNRGDVDRLTMGAGDGFRVGSVSALPTAAVGWRGYTLRVEGATGVEDGYYVCEKNADDTYGWRRLGNDVTINVRNAPYNAKGDGVADDTTALQAAINAGAGKTIVVPSGTYNFTTLTMSNARTRLVLMAGATLKKTTATTDGITVTGDNCSVDGPGRIEGPASWDGTNTTWTYAVVHVTANGFTARHLVLDNVPKVGIGLRGNNMQILGCRITGNYPSASYTGTQTVHFGITLDPTDTMPKGNVLIQGNIIRSCVSGFNTGNFGAGGPETGITISGNTFEGCWDHGIYAGGGVGHAVVGNNFSRCRVPIAVTGTRHTISGNTLTTDTTGGLNDQQGISVRNATGCVVVGNTIYGEALNSGSIISLSCEGTASPIRDNIIDANTIHITSGNVRAIAVGTGGVNPTEVSGNVVRGNVIKAPGVQFNGLILMTTPTAVRGKHNRILGNDITVTNDTYAILVQYQDHAIVDGNRIRWEFDAASAITIYGIYMQDSLDCKIANNRQVVTAAWGTNINIRGYYDVGTSDYNLIAENEFLYDLTKLASGNGLFSTAANSIRWNNRTARAWPSKETGSGAPATTRPNGSEYTDLSTGVLYRRENGAWVAK